MRVDSRLTMVHEQVRESRQSSNNGAGAGVAYTIIIKNRNNEQKYIMMTRKFKW